MSLLPLLRGFCVVEVVEAFIITERSEISYDYLLKALSEGWEEVYASCGFLVDVVARNLETYHN